MIICTMRPGRNAASRATGGIAGPRSAFYSVRHTLQTGLVLRSQDPVGVQQELWAHLTVYQALRRP